VWKNILTQSSLPCVNFISLLRAAFMHADPESAKKTDKYAVFLVLLGSGHIKAAHISKVGEIDP
jgi:hypothetical protein